MSYLAATGLDHAAELLGQGFYQNHKISRNLAADDQRLQLKWHLRQVPLYTDSRQQREFTQQELHERLTVLQLHHSPVIVKAFISSVFFLNKPVNLELLFDRFDVVVLRRKDSWKTALSAEICNTIKLWHTTHDKLENVKNSLANFKFTVDEASFLHRLRALNALKIVHDNISAFGPRHRAIAYEDFADSPRERLNELLGYNVDHCDLPVKFIDDHEAHVENIERLRELYNRYALR